MYVDAHPMLQLASALVVVGLTALVGKRLGLSMTVADVPMSSSRFWWMMAAFAVPLGVVNAVVFADGMILQVSIVIVVAGLGIWVGERFFNWRGKF
ncbi:MAG: hypothetical protein HOH95_02465 [Dehalococcoidia bacterium]|nr:hypothetical protein [Dehalococcoidia bacterium]